MEAQKLIEKRLKYFTFLVNKKRHHNTALKCNNFMGAFN
tara:strand:- start:1 stop:117 length:117 start_codon:yes stop_codon:yes gene_type:complete